MSYYINDLYNNNTNAWSNLLEELFSDSLFDTVGSKRRANIISREKEVEIQLECPGFTKEDIELSFEKGSLKVICAAKTQEEECSHQQFTLGESTNYFKLKDELDASKIKASCSEGILYINIPRKKQASAKRIKIS
jgi:HSP20 family protein